LTFVDNAVDASTDTIRLKATFANQQRQLWPGQIVEVTLRLSEEQNAVVVPATAIQNGQQGQFVFVVKEDKTVAVRPVKVSRTRGEDAIVSSGLQKGETVVTTASCGCCRGRRSPEVIAVVHTEFTEEELTRSPGVFGTDMPSCERRRISRWQNRPANDGFSHRLSFAGRFCHLLSGPSGRAALRPADAHQSAASVFSVSFSVFSV
jgi:hypothetical protein